MITGQLHKIKMEAVRGLIHNDSNENHVKATLVSDDVKVAGVIEGTKETRYDWIKRNAMCVKEIVFDKTPPPSCAIV